MRYIVSDLGPIDRHPPGMEVTDLYEPDVRDRLVEEGYLLPVEPEPLRQAQGKLAEEDEDDNGA